MRLPSRVAALSSVWTPKRLFWNSEQGIWLDPSDFSTMFQDSAGTTPVTAVEQPVGLIRDKSGRGNHASQSTSASRPLLSARVNLLTYTEQFDNAAWTQLNCSIGVDATTAPDGATTADKIKETTANGLHCVYNNTNTASKSTSYTFSVCAKANERSWITLICGDGFTSGNSTRASFNLSTGQIGTIGSSATASITPLGNGWYRCTVVGSTTAVATVVGFYCCTASADDTYSFAGTLNSGLFIWGCDARITNDGVGLPAYQRVGASTDYDTVGFPYYLKFDGTDDSLATSSIDFSATDKMSVFAGVRNLTASNNSNALCVLELSASIGTNAGTFTLFAPDSSAGVGYDYTWGSKGSNISLAKTTTPTYVALRTNIVGGVGDISGDKAILRLNGAQIVSSSDDQGTGNYGNYPLYIGRRGGSTLAYNGRLYGLIVRGAQCSATEISNAEAWMNNMAKAY